MSAKTSAPVRRASGKKQLGEVKLRGGIAGIEFGALQESIERFRLMFQRPLALANVHIQFRLRGPVPGARHQTFIDGQSLCRLTALLQRDGAGHLLMVGGAPKRER